MTDKAISRSVAGNTTKIHLVVDSRSLPVYFEISGGHFHDLVYAKSLIKPSPQVEEEVVTADKGYDSDELWVSIAALENRANILRKGNSKTENGHMDWCLYKYYHLVENAFMKIKGYRGSSTQYNKLV